MKHTTCSLIMGLSLLSGFGLAQSRPSLTTEDVLKWRAANPDRAQHFIPPQKEKAKAPPSQAQLDEQFLSAEKNWNLRLTEARTRVRDYERRAHQAELDASQSRNAFIFNDPAELNANNARVADLQERARVLRYEAQRGQATVNQLLEEGRRYGFQLTYISPRLKNGAPNEEYYRSRFLALRGEIQDEQLRTEALQLRANRLQTIINTTLNAGLAYPTAATGILFYPNNGAGDLFYLNRFRNELAGVGGALQTSQTRLSVLLAELTELQEEGRRAGVPPGIFR